MKISICIPTYDGYKDKTLEYLSDLFYTINIQTYKNFEVIVSDHSKNNNVKNFINLYDKIDIKYIKYDQKYGNISANLNNSIKNACGDIIKPMFQDDLFASEHILQIIVDNFDISKNIWGVLKSKDVNERLTNLLRVINSYYSDAVKKGHNTIGSPSVIFFKNNNYFFDEKLIWFLDTDFYYNMYKNYGYPVIINDFGIYNRCSDTQVSKSIITDEIISKEIIYLKEKYL